MSIVLDGSGTISGLNADGLASQPVFPGNVLQVVSTTKTDSFSTASTSFVDVTGLAVTITPTAATSKILVVVSVQTGAAGATPGMAFFNLVRASTDILLGDADGSRIRTSFSCWGGGGSSANEGNAAVGTNFLDTPNTTSATTYKITMRTTTGTVGVNRTAQDTNSASIPRGTSTITVMEIAA
jgi:hypothetical protein